VDIVITGRHTEVPERFRRLAEEKLAKIGQLAPKAHRADVELSHERNPRQSQNCERVEITLRGKGPVIRAEASSEDPAAALDIAFGRLLERLRRTRDRRKVHHGRQTPASLRLPVGAAARADGALHGNGDLAGGPAASAQAPDLELAEAEPEGGADDASLDGGLDGGLDGSPVVIRTKDHTATPMSLDQALYEMELVGHDFYLFVDADSRCPSVVYRRRGWSYGVIRLQVADGGEGTGTAAGAASA
jgi:ribosomal subunit interface protein